MEFKRILFLQRHTLFTCMVVIQLLFDMNNYLPQINLYNVSNSLEKVEIFAHTLVE